MLDSFQLGAIVGKGAAVQVLKIPLHQSLQHKLATDWQAQLDRFLGGVQEIEFDAGYTPEEHECFSLIDFVPPQWLAATTNASVASSISIHQNDALTSAIRGIMGVARDPGGTDLILFQNFSRSHVIQPGQFLFLQKDTYETTEKPGLALDNKLSAVYYPGSKKLLFQNFRTVNTFLPLSDYYEEATEQQIREVLTHEKLAAENVDVLATDTNQWFRKRFALLRDSGVLDIFSAKQIQARSKGYGLEIHIVKGQIVFPEAKPAAKKLLQFLNEELFRGPITDTLFEANSKREAD
jgi:hypothetical protein